MSLAVCAAAILLTGSACERGESATAPEAAAPGAHTDSPRFHRVVSLSPLATRFVLAIGAASRLVAVDPASARHAELVGVPEIDLPAALDLRPDLLLLPELPGEDPRGIAALERGGARVVEFAPHDLEDVVALVRDVGGALTGSERAGRFEAAFSRPLAKVGGSSRGRPRPRVVAVVSLDPLVVAGGHSFETDLIEIAGGHSVTHPGEETRLSIGADRWRDLDPDLVLVLAERPASQKAEQAVRNALPADAEIEFFTFDPAFWLDAPAEPALRLRALIEPLSDRALP